MDGKRRRTIELLMQLLARHEGKTDLIAYELCELVVEHDLDGKIPKALPQEAIDVAFRAANMTPKH